MSALREHLLAPPGRVAPSRVIATVSARFALTEDEILAKDRHVHVANARHVAAWLLRECGWSYPVIGKILNRDHTTIISAVKRVETERAGDAEVRAELDRLKEGILPE